MLIRIALSQVLCLSALLFFFPCAAGAEETGTPELPDRFMIRGGYSYVFNADTLFGINSSNGVNSTVDFAQLLGGDREDNVWRVDSLYRFNPRHSLGFSYYDVTRKGDRELRQDITINDITYSAGAQVKSDLGVNLYHLFYNYSFVHDEKTELELSAGLYVSTIRVDLQGTLTCTGLPSCTSGPRAAGGSSTAQTVPLPSFGFQVNYNITPRLQAQGRLDWFYVEGASFQGAMNDFYAGLEYRLLKHFSVGTAFDRFSSDLSIAPAKSTGFQYINNWNSLFVYGALYF